MNPYSSPNAPLVPQGNRYPGFLRFLVWLMPTMITVGLTVLLGFAPVHGPLVEIIAIVAVIITTGIIGLGFFDSKLKRQQHHIPQTKRGHDGKHVLKFFLLQLLIIPALSFVLLMGICSII